MKVSEVVLPMWVKGMRLCENIAVEKTPTGSDLSGYISSLLLFSDILTSVRVRKCKTP